MPAPDPKKAVDLEFPPLLDAPAPRLKAYAKETVVAEKFEAIVDLGEANSRMKDYYDLIALSRLLAFDGEVLSKAVAATFKRRNTQIPKERPPGLGTAFATDKQKVTQWTAFTRREALLLPVGDFAEAIEEIAAFVMPVALAARTNGVLSQVWDPGGPWRAPIPDAGAAAKLVLARHAIAGTGPAHGRRGSCTSQRIFRACGRHAATKRLRVVPESGRLC